MSNRSASSSASASSASASSKAPSNQGNWSPGAILQDVYRAWQLLWDPRVPLALKVLLPGAALLYWVSVIDLMPGLPFDDIAVLVLALRLFAHLASGNVESAATSQSYQQEPKPQAEAGTIETSWRVVE